MKTILYSLLKQIFHRLECCAHYGTGFLFWRVHIAMVLTEASLSPTPWKRDTGEFFEAD